jgi:hypothetical protein
MRHSSSENSMENSMPGETVPLDARHAPAALWADDRTPEGALGRDLADLAQELLGELPAEMQSKN